MDERGGVAGAGPLLPGATRERGRRGSKPRYFPQGHRRSTSRRDAPPAFHKRSYAYGGRMGRFAMDAGVVPITAAFLPQVIHRFPPFTPEQELLMSKILMVLSAANGLTL